MSEQPVVIVIKERVLDVLELVADGMTYEAIGRRLGLSRRGVEKRMAEAFLILGAKTAAHAVVLAREAGVLRINREKALRYIAEHGRQRAS